MRTWRICFLAWGVLGALLGGKAQETSKDGRPLQTEEGIGERHRRSVQGDQQPLTRRDFERQWEVLQEIRNFTLGNMVKLVAMDALLQQMNSKLPVSQNLSHTAKISSSHLIPSSTNSAVPPPPPAGTAPGPSPVRKSELRRLSEALLDADVNSVESQLILDFQGQGSTGELAPRPFFKSVNASALTGPTMRLLRALQDNYYPSITVPEIEDSEELREQEDFLDAVMKTEVMRKAEEFLHSKNLLSESLRETMKKIWFTMYPRSNGVLGSSGFEHVFVGELKGSSVSGFHNWLQFYHEEQKGLLNYKGFAKKLDFGNKGQIVETHFDWMNKTKRISTVFVGTSPELELAIFTVCFLSRRGNQCPVQMNRRRFQVQTRSFGFIGKEFISTAYPVLP